MADKPMDGRGIQVFRDGVKIGWNLLAIIATVGLGFYVSAVVYPLEKSRDEAKNDRVQIKSRLTAIEGYSRELRVDLNTFVATIDLRADQCRSDISELKKQLNNLRER